ncbi:MAG: pyridoxamine 5'-phosphate oxidase family protein [Eubacterium sp.]|nr:pyridoxamine 5'-phosphate oxidase family protein [Eubacterium sp.]
MFREMRRFKQKLEQAECIEILKNELRGVLSVLGDDGYPYGMPLDHFYDEETGKLYFHGASEGHRVDAVRACDKVSYCVYDAGYRKEGDWALNIKSVIVFGRMSELTDIAEVESVCRKLSHKFTNDEEYIDNDVAKNLKYVKVFALTPEHISGKLVNES